MTQRDERLADLFTMTELPAASIAQHARSAATGVLLRASQQWQYLQAIEVVEAMADELGRRLRIADLGGGRGALAPYLASKGHEVEIFDLDRTRTTAAIPMRNGNSGAGPRRAACGCNMARISTRLPTVARMTW